MNGSNWCTCAEFNALVEENCRRREASRAQRLAQRKAEADRYYKRVARRLALKKAAADLALIVAMGAGLAVLLQLAIRCL